MAINVELSDAVSARLSAEAARRGVGIDQVIADLAESLHPDLIRHGRPLRHSHSLQAGNPRRASPAASMSYSQTDSVATSPNTVQLGLHWCSLSVCLVLGG